MRALLLLGTVEEIVFFAKEYERSVVPISALLATGSSTKCEEGGAGMRSLRSHDKDKGKDYEHDKGKGNSAIVDKFPGKGKDKGKGKVWVCNGYNSVNADKYWKGKGKSKGYGWGYDSVNSDKCFRAKGKGKGEAKGVDSVNADKGKDDKGKDDKDKDDEARRCSSAVALSREQLAQAANADEDAKEEEDGSGSAEDVDEDEGAKVLSQNDDEGAKVLSQRSFSCLLGCGLLAPLLEEDSGVCDVCSAQVEASGVQACKECDFWLCHRCQERLRGEDGGSAEDEVENDGAKVLLKAKKGEG